MKCDECLLVNQHKLQCSIGQAKLTVRKRRSYSQMSLYQECPEAYRWKYVDKVPEAPSVWSVGGVAFHTVAEEYLRGQMGPDPDDDRIFVAWMEAWHAAYEEVINHPRFAGDPDMATWRKANRGTEGKDWWIEEGFAMCRRFVRWCRTKGQDLIVFDHNGEPGLELELEVELGGVSLIAIPDAIVIDEHGQLNIMDYKSGKPPKSTLQLGVYKAAIKAKTGLDATWGLYYMARPGELLPRDLAKWTPELIGELFADFDLRERSGDYAPTPGEACRFCPHKKTRCTYYNPQENA